ncbi:MAG: CoA transferase [Geminicoccaceae bacterium]|nr:MAG: CoA transferase [Geminicoccaceae bacterium]
MSALSHLRVLDLTRVRAGPVCCRVLADYGADVIRIEAPEGLDANAGITGARDGYDNQNLHRSKRFLTLNLKHPEGLALFRRLVETADIVVENFRPDVKDRLGIGYDALRAINPRIILVSISGFGQDGPYAKRPGFDQIAQGMGGLMAVTGLPGQGPVRAGAAVADVAAGLYGAIGALAALAERERSGEGQWVQTSLLEAQIGLLDFQAARYLVDGVAPGQAGNDHPVSTPMGVVETADGHINLGVGGDGQWRSLCQALDLGHLATHPDFATTEARLARRAEVWAILRPIFKRHGSAEWLERLERAHVPAGPIYPMDEVFADPQVEHLGIAKAVEHPTRGRIRVVGQPVTLTRTPPTIKNPIREPGADTDAILGDLGLDAAAIAGLREAGVV